MRCPACDGPMREVERRGVRIDVCTECKGVWLDRGELDKLVAAERAEPYEDWSEPPGRDRERNYHPDRHRSDHGYYQGYHGHPKKKKKRLFEELFEIFD